MIDPDVNEDDLEDDEVKIASRDATIADFFAAAELLIKYLRSGLPQKAANWRPSY
jgi:hypothetical protein